MKRNVGTLAAAVLALALAGCAGAPLPPAPTTAVPDLRGTWTGTWGGSPLTLLLVEQQGMAPVAGVHLGPAPLLGPRRPGLSGVMTFTVRGEAISVGVRGWLGSSNRTFVLVLEAAPPTGTQQLRLTTVGDHLAGTGESSFGWGPQGPIELTRRAASPAMSRRSGGPGNAPAVHRCA